MRRRVIPLAMFVAAPLWVGGCSAPGTGFDQVRSDTGERTGYGLVWSRGRRRTGGCRRTWPTGWTGR